MSEGDCRLKSQNSAQMRLSPKITRSPGKQRESKQREALPPVSSAAVLKPTSSSINSTTNLRYRVKMLPEAMVEDVDQSMPQTLQLNNQRTKLSTESLKLNFLSAAALEEAGNTSAGRASEHHESSAHLPRPH